MELLRVVVAVAFTLLAVVAARIWLAQRSRASAWLAAAFACLAAGLVVARLQPVIPDGVEPLAERLTRVTVLAFPYLLFRFAGSLRAPSRPVRVAGDVLGALMLASALVLPPPGEAAVPAWYTAWVVLLLGVWTLLSAWVVKRFWVAGHAQPTVARRRLRTLAAAAAVLNVGLVVTGLSGTVGGPPWLGPAVQSVGLLSALLFLVAFAAPPALRSAWRREDERALWRAESRLVAATSADEVVASMLPHISHLLGGGPALFLERSGREHVYGTPAPELRARVRDAAGDLEDVTADALVLDVRSGRLGVAASPYTPLFATDELELARWLGTLVDLALNRVELHEGERVARLRAEELTRELEALVYGITHDLRNPIIAVLGYLDCLAEDYGPELDGDGMRFVTRSRANAEYMDRLIGDLLALSRVGRVPAEPQALDLSGVAREVADELGAVNRQATVEVRDLPVVMMNPLRARQLLTNLVNNALVHSGRPDVTVRVAALDSPMPGQAWVAVTDDGKGIPKEYRTRVFGLFERLEPGDKTEGNGTGIGLAMCQRIVAQAGGRIWIADTDEGTSVRLQLPLAQDVPRQSEGVG